MSAPAQALLRSLSDYGMLFVLAGVCAFFSIATWSRQYPDGEAATGQVASNIARQLGKGARVMIAARAQPEDAAFAGKLQRELAGAGAQVIEVVQGEPKDARDALLRIAARGEKLDAIACTEVAATWLVFSELQSDFPALGNPRVIRPQSYHWPNFLKKENLLNITNQIAVIAIVAVGMTMVIITGGIDLSVGSLIALSAVLAGLFIREAAGGVSATAAGMTLACVGAVAICGLVGGFSGAMITLCSIPPFIVTLAMMLVASGLAYLLAHGQSVYQIPDSFVWLGRGAGLFGMPNAVFLMLVLYAGAHVLMSRMKLGRYIYAVGGNAEA
ncbi:MAG: ABC transporter permease, partial [Verrucomicrobiota bacterium]|nr:ABC transporter permease [Verrucomicrobiota bacterium]